jgi:tryptophanase
MIEPFRIKVVEPIRMTSKAQREQILQQAGFNMFGIRAEDVIVDLLTDSGTGAMSAQQWAGVMQGDESYAGSASFFRFRDSIREITGFDHILPTHQGRANERILFELLGGSGRVVPNNMHFDTTRANVEHSGAVALDLPIPEAADATCQHPFKGNVNIQALQDLLRRQAPGTVPAVMVTVTNNSGGGQPVSLENLRQVRDLCDRHGIPLILDACRFAENAYLIKQREAGQAERSARDIARDMFDLADGASISAKKDGLVNIGGILLLRDPELLRRASELLILTEGYVTYGGLAGRDLEAMAQGFQEVLDEDYLAYRIRVSEYTANKLRAAGIPILEPPGGHAVYLDAGRFLSHIPAEQFPGQALVCALFRLAGVRSVEIGSLMFGNATGRPPLELVRLAFPRRVYTVSHIDYVIEAVLELHADRDTIRGLSIVEAPPALRHFTARLEELQPV